MQNQWLRITEKGVLTVGKIEGNYVQYVNDLELLDGGQIRFADDGVMALRAAASPASSPTATNGGLPR